MPSPLKSQTEFEDTIKSPGLTVIHFEAKWAEQCVQVNELLDTLARQSSFADVKFFTCNAEDLNEVSIKYNIEAVPTVLLFKQGEKVERVDGADAAKITEKVKLHLNKEAGDLNERLKTLINQSKVMLFMKGDRNTPRCGFSRQIIEILNNTSVPYETFDILQDEEVRQGLKTYSDWPTYPQLYVNGDLVGGLDIVKEMLASGDFISTLKS